MRIPVFLAGWEIECCQPRPASGDHVEWPLEWSPSSSGPGLLDVPWQVVRPLPRGQDADRSGIELQHGRVTAWWRGTAQPEVPTHGRLLAELHGGVPAEVAATVGRVIGVEVVDQAYRRSARRTYVPIDGDVVLREVNRSPERFVCHDDALPDFMRADSGVLVLLDVGSAIAT